MSSWPRRSSTPFPCEENASFHSKYSFAGPVPPPLPAAERRTHVRLACDRLEIKVLIVHCGPLPGNRPPDGRSPQLVLERPGGGVAERMGRHKRVWPNSMFREWGRAELNSFQLSTRVKYTFAVCVSACISPHGYNTAALLPVTVSEQSKQPHKMN